MADIRAHSVVKQLAGAIPKACHANIVLVGSLAAAYQLIDDDGVSSVRTKDADCVVIPRLVAGLKGQEVAEELLRAGWTTRREGEHGQPGTSTTDTADLPLIRLYPPEHREWFLEFLTVRDSGKPGTEGEWERVTTTKGDFALRGFEFSPLLAFKPDSTPYGICCARPEMMALANMLEHPIIKPAVMSSLFEGRRIKRSNKDLGRVLSLAYLAGDERVQRWGLAWKHAIRECFPSRHDELCLRAGLGIRALLRSQSDLEEAWHTCSYGLLTGRNVTVEQLRIAGQRLVQDAVSQLEGA